MNTTVIRDRILLDLIEPRRLREHPDWIMAIMVEARDLRISPRSESRSRRRASFSKSSAGGATLRSVYIPHSLQDQPTHQRRLQP
jgi:hypothetical protein